MFDEPPSYFSALRSQKKKKKNLERWDIFKISGRDIYVSHAIVRPIIWDHFVRMK